MHVEMLARSFLHKVEGSLYALGPRSVSGAALTVCRGLGFLVCGHKCMLRIQGCSVINRSANGVGIRIALLPLLEPKADFTDIKALTGDTPSARRALHKPVAMP